MNCPVFSLAFFPNDPVVDPVLLVFFLMATILATVLSFIRDRRNHTCDRFVPPHDTLDPVRYPVGRLCIDVECTTHMPRTYRLSPPCTPYGIRPIGSPGSPGSPDSPDSPGYPDLE